MTVAAKTTFGNRVFMNAAPAPAATAVAELLDFDPPKGSREMEDATSHDSPAGAMEFIPAGTYDPGEMSLTVNYIADSIGDQAMTAAMTGGGLQNMGIRFKAADGFQAWTFQAYVTGYGPDAQPVRGKQTATLSLKVTGAITKAAVAP